MARTFELLAPAKNVQCAREAILHGADAVYIGAPKYGARAAAGNSIEELKDLVVFAHQYYVRIYVTVNTILYEHELKEVEELIWQLWEIGVDALIVQDMGITKLNLPPIPLHASTQMDNRTTEKVQFLRDAGFRQIVLARELSLNQIKAISDTLDSDRKAQGKQPVALEAFIHGALCVSYSGQCYLSYAMSGRSANRGCCAQYCRMAYDLIDGDGRELIHQKYLLSLKDLHKSASDIEALMDAGVTSFKIEGRLKDVDYCKNITAWYRQQIDAIIERHPGWKRSSSGSENISFQPNPSKSFNRTFTDYFLHGRNSIVCNTDTPKSMGEEMGFVRAQKLQHFVYLGKEPLHNGDGISYFNEQGSFDGFRVNRVEGNHVYPANPKLRLKTGIKLYRTYDQIFSQFLSKPTATRTIPIRIECRELPWGYSLQMDDHEGHRAAVSFTTGKITADKPQKDKIQALLSKTTDPLFKVESCEMMWNDDCFLPLSLWTEQRNRLYSLFRRVRDIQYPKKELAWQQTTHPFPAQESLTYTGNVLNSAAADFYKQHSVRQITPAIESASEKAINVPIELMRCKHCLRYTLHACPKQQDSQPLNEPLYLRLNGTLLPLHFDCKNCEMVVGSPLSGQI